MCYPRTHANIWRIAIFSFLIIIVYGKGRICGLLSNSLPRPTPSEGGARLPVCKRQTKRAPSEEGFSQRSTPLLAK
jgi:hypothetical protein